MNITIFFIEAVLLILVFTGLIIIPLIKNPLWWIHDYPKDIREEYFKTHERIPTSVKDKTVFIKKAAAMIFAAFVLCVLTFFAGGHDFISGFLISYALWSVVNWYDCFFLDWVLFANLKKIRLPGTESMDKAYHQKLYHFRRALIGAALGLIPALLVGTIIGIIK